MEDRQRTTKSILDNYSGDVLDVPNADKKILDELPKETILDELGKINDKTFNDEFYDLS